MSQDIRRCLVARERLHPALSREADMPAPLQVRRFSQGLRRAVLDQLRTAKLGRFSRGAECLPENYPSKSRIDRSDGLDHVPADAPNRLGVARFSHGIDHGDVQSAQPAQPGAVRSRCPSEP
jgi:hypothetical protein